MARIRSVSPALRTSETAAAWPLPTRYAWVLLWGYLDDYGRGVDNARVIAADCFPLDDEITGAVMGEWLAMYAKAGSICRYEHDGKRLLHALNWSDHQKPQHPSKARIAPCREHEAGAFSTWSKAREEEHRKVSGSPHEDLVTASPTSRGGGGVEKETRGRALTRCPSHLNDPFPPPCGRCKELRLAAEQAVHSLALVPAGPPCPDHAGQLAHNCRSCAADRKALA
jgi:hypothetical protein